MSMKKIGVYLLLVLILISIPLILSEENETTSNSTISTSSNTSSGSNSEKIDKGFECLEEKVGDCSGLSVQEMALTIIATPKDSVLDSCIKELKEKESGNNWGNVRDTSLAILALKHSGEETKDYEEWLLDQEKTPTDLIWYLQQDSNEKTECHIKYDTNDYSFIVEENKKIDKNSGSCLTLAQANFWYKVSPECYEKDFVLECDKDFIASLLYKNKDSPTIFVLEGTQNSPAYGSITINVKSKCFGDTSCDYESTIWATLALLETGHDITNYIPYVIAMSETNKRYLPEAFIYMITNYEDYANQLVANQELGNYWEATSTAYSKYYDTSLAIIAIGSSSSEPIKKAKDWLIFSQGTNGCWQNSIRDTAISLWALAGRAGKGPSGGSSVTYCTQANYFCIPSSDCPSSDNIGDSYFCPSLSQTCCKTENLKSCSEYEGQVCSSGMVCTGLEKKATDTNYCCVGECSTPSEESECEANFYSCMDSCSEYQVEVDEYACNSGEVCCKMKPADEGGSSWWIWVLILLILIVLGVIAYIKRDELKLFLFKLKSKFKKDKGEGNSNFGRGGPGIPPKPGFPPIRRMPMQRPPLRKMNSAPQRHYDRRDPDMQDTFRKLREMADKR